MARLHEYKDSSEKVLMQDVVLDVVCMVLHAERQQLQDQAEQLHRAGVHALRIISARIGQEGRCSDGQELVISRQRKFCSVQNSPINTCIQCL